MLTPEHQSVVLNLLKNRRAMLVSDLDQIQAAGRDWRELHGGTVHDFLTSDEGQTLVASYHRKYGLVPTEDFGSYADE